MIFERILIGLGGSMMRQGCRKLDSRRSMKPDRALIHLSPDPNGGVENTVSGGREIRLHASRVRRGRRAGKHGDADCGRWIKQSGSLFQAWRSWQ